MKTAITENPLPASVLAPDNYSYREREWRAPKVDADEEIIFDEPGRVLGRRDPTRPSDGVDCRSHYFRVTHPRFGRYRLRVQHGGGEQHWELSYDKRIIEGLAMMDSDSRFRLLWVLMDANNDSERRGASRVESVWRCAAAEKRIRTRKGRGGVTVWIEPSYPTHSPSVAVP